MTERHPPGALRQLVLARIRLFYREPSTVFWSFVFPLALTVALGIAFRSRPPEALGVGVVEGPRAGGVAAALVADRELRVERLGEAAAGAALRTGRVALVVQPGTPPLLRFDPTRPEGRLARAVAADLLERAAGRRDVVGPVPTPVTEPGSRYVDFLLPGLVGMNVMSTGMWGLGYVIVETRQKRLLKRMAATPMRRGHFLLSFAAVRALFLAIELPTLIGFGVLAFGVPLRGSLVALAVVAALGAAAFAGLGLLVASRARNTQTVSGLINAVMMPMMLLSGVFFSSANFPAALQPAIRGLPLTALNDGLRAVMIEGATLLQVAPQCLLLAAVAAGSFALALRIFRWS